MDRLPVSLLMSSFWRSSLLSRSESVHANRSENWSGLEEQHYAPTRLPDQLKGTTNKAEESKVEKMEGRRSYDRSEMTNLALKSVISWKC